MVLNIGIYVYIEYLIIFIVIKVLVVQMACDNLPQGLWQIAPKWDQKVSLDSEHKMFKIFDKNVVTWVITCSIITWNIVGNFCREGWLKLARGMRRRFNL